MRHGVNDIPAIGWGSVGAGDTLGVYMGSDVVWYTVVCSEVADDVGITDGENSGVVEPAGFGDIVGL